MNQYSRKNIVKALQSAFDEYVNVTNTSAIRLDRKNVLQFKKWLPENESKLSVFELNSEYRRLSQYQITDFYDRFNNWFKYVK